MIENRWWDVWMPPWSTTD